MESDTPAQNGGNNGESTAGENPALAPNHTIDKSNVQAIAKPKGRQLLKMRLKEIRDYNPLIRELFLQCEDPAQFHFKAGQFVMLHVPAEPKALLRAYSIASDDRRKDGYRLIFKFVEGGLGSKFVWSLKGGELLDFTGPFGRVVFSDPPREQVIFLNTGSGVSQHFSFIESNVEKHPDVKYRLLFGVRTEADIYYVEELERLKKLARDFKYEFVLSRASESWTGKRGYVQNFNSRVRLPQRQLDLLSLRQWRDDQRRQSAVGCREL